MSSLYPHPSITFLPLRTILIIPSFVKREGCFVDIFVEQPYYPDLGQTILYHTIAHLARADLVWYSLIIAGPQQYLPNNLRSLGTAEQILSVFQDKSIKHPITKTSTQSIVLIIAVS